MAQIKTMIAKGNTNMMYGFNMYGGGGWWILGMGMMVLFLIAIILLVIWVVRSLFPRQMRSGHDQALETLRQRFAAGEINAAEYEQARARVEQIPVA
jgi:putative membrane protein